MEYKEIWMLTIQRRNVSLNDDLQVHAIHLSEILNQQWDDISWKVQILQSYMFTTFESIIKVLP